MEAYFIIILIILSIYIVYRIQDNRAKLARKELWQAKNAEARRLSECEDVIRYFANYHGYVARSVVSRDELEDMINEGATARI